VEGTGRERRDEQQQERALVGCQGGHRQDSGAWNAGENMPHATVRVCWTAAPDSSVALDDVEHDAEWVPDVEVVGRMRPDRYECAPRPLEKYERLVAVGDVERRDDGVVRSR